MISKTFHGSDTVEEVEFERKKIQFIYTRGTESFFCDPDTPSKRFTIDTKYIQGVDLLYEKLIVEAIYICDEIIRVEAPPKVMLIVKNTAGDDRGNTAHGGTKSATLENSKVIQVPLFIKIGDKNNNQHSNWQVRGEGKIDRI